MIGGRSALLAAAGGGNPYGNWTGNYSDVSLLLRNGTPSGLLIPLDESPTPKAIATFGNASITTAVVKYGTSAMAFDGSGDYFETPANADFDFGIGDFTIECWVNFNTLATDQTFVSYAAGTSGSVFSFGLERLNTGSFRCIIYSGSTFYGATITPSPAVEAGTWYHVAGVRSGGQLRIYVNGVGGTAVNANVSVNAAAGRILVVGAFYNTVRFVNGYIDDLRITKGFARYTDNFTPPTAELPANTIGDPSYNSVSLLLRNGTPSGLLIPLDESPTPKAIATFGNASITTTVVKYGTSAMVFDGSGDYFETPATTDFNFDNGPFTIEAWINAVSLTDGNTIFSNMNGGWLSSPQLTGYSFRVTSTGALNFAEFQSLDVLYNFTSAAGVIATGEWYHVAVCKEGTGTNQVRLFVDGAIVASGTRNANIPFSTSGLLARIGAERAGAGTNPFFNGYIDDLRITKGFARYTKNFLPPPAELPAI